LEQQSFVKRTILPAIPIMIIVVISYFGYFGSRAISIEWLQSIMAFVFGTTYFLSVAFGALYVYFKSYFRGASTAERIFASSITPFLWMTSGALLLTESHPLVEAFYWYLSPLNLALIFLVCLELGAATLIARKIHKSRGHEIKIITPAPIIVIAVSLFMLVGGYAWGSGENLFVLFLEGYRAIFGSGL
jgi:hypothetical protein